MQQTLRSTTSKAPQSGGFSTAGDLSGAGSRAEAGRAQEQGGAKASDHVPFESTLRRIMSDQTVHARFLNTLALLEHMGCRKMVKALDSNRLTRELLDHISEEARHAAFFKELAERVCKEASKSFQEDDLLAGSESRAYFQELDAQIAQKLVDLGLTSAHSDGPQTSFVTYLAVTTAIEARATKLYGEYEELLQASGSPFSLRSVLLEEQGHLEEMRDCWSRAGVDMDSIRAPLAEIEEALFERWHGALRHALTSASA